MLEGVVQSRHLDELDRSVEVLGEPELFEVRDMPEIPDDGTHQGIVLEVEIFVREGGHEQERSRPRFLQLVRRSLPGPHGLTRRCPSCNDSPIGRGNRVRRRLWD